VPTCNLARGLPVIEREAHGDALLEVHVPDEDRAAERRRVRAGQRKGLQMHVRVRVRVWGGYGARPRRDRVDLVER